MIDRVAIVGRFCAGKTTLARELEEYGFVRVSMAANLKSIVGAVYGTLDKSGTVEVTDDTGRERRISVREVLQQIGQAVKTVDRDFWLKWMLEDTAIMSGQSLVMDDMRLLFEADLLRARGWTIVKLETPELERIERHFRLYGRYPTDAEMSHQTETESDLIQAHLTFDGREPVEEIADQIMAYLEEERLDDMSRV